MHKDKQLINKVKSCFERRPMINKVVILEEEGLCRLQVTTPGAFLEFSDMSVNCIVVVIFKRKSLINQALRDTTN